MNISRVKKIQRKLPRLNSKQLLSIELGCGRTPRKGYIGIDIEDYGQDIIWDIEEGLPFSDNTISNIYSSHVFEHLGEIVDVMNECHRTLVPNGELYIVVPTIKNERAYIPTHVNFIDENYFRFFTRADAQDYGMKQWIVVEQVINSRGDMHVKLTPIK